LWAGATILQIALITVVVVAVAGAVLTRRKAE
jgi:hypothetical protein